MAKHESLGFEPEVVTDALVTLLVREGGVAEEDPRVVVWRAAPQSDEERARRWNYAWLLGWEHLPHHGIQSDGVICAHMPCRIAGISAAIVQLTSHLGETTDPHGVVATLDEITTYLNKRANDLPELVRFVEKHGKTRSTLSSASESAAGAILHMIRLQQALMQTQAHLLLQLESPQFRQAINGRPATHLLRAIYQHLRLAGGFSFAELASIALTTAELDARDGGLAFAEQALLSKIDSIEKLVTAEDQRTWHPFVRTHSSPQEETPPATLLDCTDAPGGALVGSDAQPVSPSALVPPS